MPLTASNFVPQGPVRSLDIRQFYDLLTGVMVDQPITLSNVVNIGGNQPQASVPLKIYGAIGQSTHLIDLYADRTQAQPGFGFSAAGDFGWGPGADAPIDTTLSRIGTQLGGADRPGLLITPELGVQGNLTLSGGINFASGGAISDGGNAGVNVGTNLAVGTNLYVGFDKAQYLHEVRPTVLGIAPIVAAGTGADPWGASLAYASATALVAKAVDLPDTAGALTIPFSAHAFGGNWLQFNTRLQRITAGNGWPGVALTLAFDVDNSPGAGGQLVFQNGRVGIDGAPNTSAQTLQVFGSAWVGGALTVAGQPNAANRMLEVWNAPGTLLWSVDNAGNVASAARVTAGGDMLIGNGTLYLTPAGDTFLNRPSAAVVGIGSNLATPGYGTFGNYVSVGQYLAVGTLATVGSYLAVGGSPASSGSIRLPAGGQILWNVGGQEGIWIDSSGYFNLKQGQGLAGGASGGSVGVPQNCRGFLQVQIDGTGLCKIPLYNN